MKNEPRVRMLECVPSRLCSKRKWICPLFYWLLWCVNLIVSLQWRLNGRDGFSNNQPYDYLPNRLFRSRSKKTSKLRVIGLRGGNSPVAGEFPAQMASNAENVSIWWRHHDVTSTLTSPSLGTASSPHHTFTPGSSGNQLLSGIVKCVTDLELGLARYNVQIIWAADSRITVIISSIPSF